MSYPTMFITVVVLLVFEAAVARWRDDKLSKRVSALEDRRDR